MKANQKINQKIKNWIKSNIGNTFENGFSFENSDISMPNGGSTTIYILHGEYYQFSSGQNWSDQEPTLIGDLDDCVQFVFSNRKDINAELKANYNFLL